MTELELRLSPADAHDTAACRRAAAQKLGVPETAISDFQILRRSIDARGRDAVFQLRIAVILRGGNLRPNLPFYPNSKMWRTNRVF